MSTIDLAAIGLKAIEYMQTVQIRKGANFTFGRACARWKRRNGIEFVEKGSDEWTRMMDGVSGPYSKRERAKADERNARERLFRACLKEEARIAQAESLNGKAT